MLEQQLFDALQRKAMDEISSLIAELPAESGAHAAVSRRALWWS
jgi:hypothetical protein